VFVVSQFEIHERKGFPKFQTYPIDPKTYIYKRILYKTILNDLYIVIDSCWLSVE